MYGGNRTPPKSFMLVFYCPGFYQFKITGFKSVVNNFALYLCRSNCITKSITRMSIAMFINTGTIYKIGFPTRAYGKVATFAG